MYKDDIFRVNRVRFGMASLVSIIFGILFSSRICVVYKFVRSLEVVNRWNFVMKFTIE